MVTGPQTLLIEPKKPVDIKMSLITRNPDGGPLARACVQTAFLSPADSGISLAKANITNAETMTGKKDKQKQKTHTNISAPTPCYVTLGHLFRRLIVSVYCGIRNRLASGFLLE